MVKKLPAMRETWVRSLSWEESSGGGHDNPLQSSCLADPMDRGAGGLQPVGTTEHGMSTDVREMLKSPLSLYLGQLLPFGLFLFRCCFSRHVDVHEYNMLLMY